MKLVVIGVNHKTAPVAIREQLAFGEDLPDALTALREKSGGAMIVSTCNRSEIYAYLPDSTSASVTDNGVDVPINDVAARTESLLAWLSEFKGVARDEMAPYLYIYHDSRALNHWLRVAVGLDSMILGEPQILGQMRQAVAVAHQSGAISSAFGWLTQRIFAAARVVRRDTDLGAQAVTLGFATAKLVTQIFDKPEQTTLLIVAAGEMNRLVAHNVASLGMQRIIIANRSPERAQRLKDELTQMAAADGRQVEIRLAPLDDLAAQLALSDVVSSCSGSMQALIDVPMVQTAMRARRQRSMLLVDLAVPRDIEAAVGRLDNVYLYSIDDLQHVIAGNIESRKQAAVEAELLVSQLTADIEAQRQLKDIGGMICQYQDMRKAKQQQLLDDAKSALAHGADAHDVLDMLVHKLGNVLAHPVLKLMRDAAVSQDDATMDYIAAQLNQAYRKQK